MGQGKLLAAGFALSLALLGLARVAAAQGPLYRERFAVMHLELLRERVQRESAARDDATMAAVAADLAEPDAIPFRPAARALARLRGVPCDDRFLLRAMVSAFALPEVVDPIGAQEACRQLAVSLFLPYSIELPGAVSFEVEVVTATGEAVFTGSVAEDTDLEGLRMARPHLTVPAVELPDGTYRLRVRTVVDGEAPRASDPVLEHVFHVLRNYQARAEGACADAALLLQRLAGTDRALLLGLALEVQRAFAGEAFERESDAVRDLQRLEAAVENVTAGRKVLHGMTGPVPTALPTGGEAVLSAVLPAGVADGDRRPIVVIAGMAPAYDVRARRPGAPAAHGARSVQGRVGDLGLGAAGHVVWLQSPGGGVPYARALATALPALRELVPNDGRVVLVLELDAAVALSFAPDLLQREASAVALVGAGAFAKPMLEAVAGVPMFGVTLTGHPSSDGLRRTADLVAGRFGEAPVGAQFDLAREAPRPWTSGAAAARAEIAAFVRKALAAK